MPTTTRPSAIEPCPPGSALRQAALHHLMGVPHTPGSTSEAVLRLLEQAPMGIDPVFAVRHGKDLGFAAAAMPSPGATALLLTSKPPGPVEPPFAAADRSVLEEAAGDAVAAIGEDLGSGGVSLLQALLLPGDEPTERILARGGLRKLTCLVYLRARADAAKGSPRALHTATGDNPDVRWHTYSDATHGLFAAAIRATYEDSQDCPELSPLRKIDDVIAGHRAVGRFDPRLWSVATAGGTPAAAVLLNRLDHGSAAEIVYIGVAQPYRCRGLASEALTRAFALARRDSVTNVALAVDERNSAARRLYERWGFVETGVRDAWIATLSHT